jgi:hypothetical protein
MRELSKQTGLDVLLSRICGRTIMTVHIKTAGVNAEFWKTAAAAAVSRIELQSHFGFPAARAAAPSYKDGRAAGDSDAMAKDWGAFFRSMQ